MNNNIQDRLFWLLIFSFAIFCVSLIILFLNVLLLIDKVRLIERQGMFLSTSVEKLNNQLIDLELIESYYEEKD